MRKKKELEELEELTQKDKELTQETGELEELRKQNEEYLAGWKRALADYTNLQGELMEQRAGMRESIKEEFVSSLLPILDNFDQALRFKPEECGKDIENWLQGVLHVKAQFETLLEQFDATAFGHAGEQFDPELHTAISTREEGEKNDQEILEVQVRGWKLNEKVIRSASVIINNLAS